MLAKNENLAEFDLSTFVFDIGKMVALLASHITQIREQMSGLEIS